MTYNDYIKNPMGKKNAVFSKRELYYGLYSDKFDKILVRENGKITYNQFVDKKNDKYYIYIKIPSEVIAKFYYDVVIEFSSTNPLSKGVQNLEGYDVRFFSNDPAFVFTFAHAFITNDVFITELKPKMSKLAVKTVATEKNPKDELGYVKSLFFAYLFIKQRGLFKKISFVDAANINFKQLIPVIMHADEKIKLRQEAQAEYDKQLRIEKNKQQNKNKTTENVANNNMTGGKLSAVKVTKAVKMADKMRTVKTAKRTRKI